MVKTLKYVLSKWNDLAVNFVQKVLKHPRLCQPCLVPSPLSVFHLGQSVSDHVVRSATYRNELIMRAWEKAAQGLGKSQPKLDGELFSSLYRYTAVSTKVVQKKRKRTRQCRKVVWEMLNKF